MPVKKRKPSAPSLRSSPTKRRKQTSADSTSSAGDEPGMSIPSLHRVPIQPTVDEAGNADEGNVDVIIALGTTANMQQYIGELRKRIRDLLLRLQEDIPGMRIAVISHGYNNAIIKVDLGATLDEVCEFFNDLTSLDLTVRNGREKYDLVEEARDMLARKLRCQGAVIIIGDDCDYPLSISNDDKLFNSGWQNVCKELLKMNVKVYFGLAGESLRVITLYKAISLATNGKYLQLPEVTSIFDILMLICYREGNADLIPVYEQELRARPAGLTTDIETILRTFGVLPPPIIKHTHAPHPTAKHGKKLKAAKAKTIGKPAVNGRSKKPANKNVVKTQGVKIMSGKDAKRRKKKKTRTWRHREDIADGKMNMGPLKHLRWSRWEPFIIQEDKAVGKGFKKCQYLEGYVATSMFKNDRSPPALYEVAVQLPGKKKKYVTYFRKSVGFYKFGSWDLYLIRHATSMKQLDILYKKGCSFFCRRGVPKETRRKTQVNQIWAANVFLRKTIDYAWRKWLYGKKKQRRVVRNKIEISTDTI